MFKHIKQVICLENTTSLLLVSDRQETGMDWQNDWSFTTSTSDN